MGADQLFNPVWNTLDVGRYLDIDQEAVLENARIGVKLGFKIVMIDAGWFCKNEKEWAQGKGWC